MIWDEIQKRNGRLRGATQRAPLELRARRQDCLCGGQETATGALHPSHEQVIGLKRVGDWWRQSVAVVVALDVVLWLVGGDDEGPVSARASKPRASAASTDHSGSAEQLIKSAALARAFQATLRRLSRAFHWASRWTRSSIKNAGSKTICWSDRELWPQPRSSERPRFSSPTHLRAALECAPVKIKTTS